MDIEATYQKILSDIKLGHRGLYRFSMAEADILKEVLLKTWSEKNYDLMEKTLCIVEHSAGLLPSFEDIIIMLMNPELPDHLIIFALNCGRKHIIQLRFQKGQRLSFEYLEALKNLLSVKSPEVLEWTLRTIEECGNQGVYFLREFDKIKPPPWKWFNQHQRSVRELIAMMERRWGHFEKSK